MRGFTCGAQPTPSPQMGLQILSHHIHPMDQTWSIQQLGSRGGDDGHFGIQGKGLALNLADEEEDQEPAIKTTSATAKNGHTKLCARGHWRPAEDAKLKELVTQYGPQNWNLIAKNLEGRSGKSCRLRWFNQLDSRINRRAFSEEQEDKLLAAHRLYGNKWAMIARLFPGRTDNRETTYCKFHKARRHGTDVCRELKAAIERIVEEGYLGEFSTKAREETTKNPANRAARDRPSLLPNLRNDTAIAGGSKEALLVDDDDIPIINVIAGGASSTDDSILLTSVLGEKRKRKGVFVGGKEISVLDRMVISSREVSSSPNIEKMTWEGSRDQTKFSFVIHVNSLTQSSVNCGKDRRN